MAKPTTSIDQTKSAAGHDMVGGNKTTFNTVNHYGSGNSANILPSLMEKLAQEIADDVTSKITIDTLLFYQKNRSHDGIVGLEAKLLKAGRRSELLDAFDYKELFVKLLYRYSLYASAQEIFAYLLARVDRRFRAHVEPLLGEIDETQIDALIYEKIVEPVSNELGSGVFTINDAIVLGMIYWLAEQCFVRWHK